MELVKDWQKIEAVQRMQDYIERNICRPITLSGLSKHAGYSPFYCSRVFKELLGMPPFEYIRALRLTRAALMLRDEKPKIVDVALEFVFDSHEGFTRAFSKEFGITPKKYRSNPPPVYLFMPNSIRDKFLYYLKGDKKMETKSATTVFVQVIKRPERKLILKRGKNAEDYFSYCEEVGCDIGGLLCSVKEALYEPIGVWLPDNLRTAGTSKYAQGVEVPADYAGEVPEGLSVINSVLLSLMLSATEFYQREA